MNRDEARDYLISHARDYLSPDKSRKGFVCPICGSGSGAKGTGVSTKDNGRHFSCWAGCFTNADIIDIFGMKAGATTYREKLEAACKEAGIHIDADISSYRQKVSRSEAASPAPETEPETDYTEYCKACANRLSETDYHRGISEATLQRFGVGFDPAWKHPKVTSAYVPTSPRLIIPTSANSYLARDTRKPEEIPEAAKAYTKSKVGKVHIFNLEALDDPTRPTIIVEGEIDALSIIDVGGSALGLGSVSNVSKLLDYLSNKELEQPLIIALDNDASGEKAAKKLESELQTRGITFYRRDICEGIHRLDGKQAKDANEALMADREALAEAVDAAKNAGNEEILAYLGTSAGANLQGFIDGISSGVDTLCIPTGFNDLDNALDGGFYEGLYTIGAIPSIGKTTLALQIADQVAAAGTDVLIFSLEMARSELMARSISRHTLQIALRDDGNSRNAKTARGITDGRRRAHYSSRELDIIDAAVYAYSDYADRIYIQEGIGNYDVWEIKKTVEKHLLYTGRKPLVIVDYLQILAPADVRATDKQNTDTAVLALKRLSRDCKIPIVVVSAFNRAGYNQAANFEQLKESGAIEYGSDVVMGMQLKGVGSTNFNATEAKDKDPREIELVILKYRQGQVGTKLQFEYYPKFNYFKEKTTEQAHREE